MKPANFPQSNSVIGEGQPQYEPLPAHIDRDNPATPCLVCFELDDDEIKEIVRTRRLYLTQFTFKQSFMPMRMSLYNPFELPIHGADGIDYIVSLKYPDAYNAIVHYLTNAGQMFNLYTDGHVESPERYFSFDTLDSFKSLMDFQLEYPLDAD